MFTKKLWKIVGLSAACGLLVLLILYVGVTWWSTHRLEARLAKLRAAGEPTSIRELELSVPADDNAALVLENVWPQLEAFSKSQVTFDKTPAGETYFDSAYKTGRPTEEQINMIRGILAMYPEVPPVLEKAASCDYYASPYDYSLDPPHFMEALLPSISFGRTVSRFCSWQIAVAIVDGEYDKAAQIGINMLKLARLRDAEPTITSGLLGLALRGAAVRELNRVLRSGALSSDLRLRLDQELAAHDDALWLVNALKTERAYNLEASSDLFSAFPMTWQGRLLQGDMLSLYEELLPILAKPWYKSNYEFDSIIAHSYSTPISDSMVQLMFPALQAAHDAYHRTIAEMRCLRILNALQAYEEESGREAESLDDLELPASSLFDPFDGKPLKLKLTGDGWVIYSVFRNRKDDGGEIGFDEDWGVAPLGYPGAD